MSFYVTDWVKQTDVDGRECYYPRGIGSGMRFGALDLRPAGVLVGPAFVSTPEALSGTGITKLGDAKGETLTGARRNTIQTLTGFSAGQTRIDLILAELMTTGGRLWNPLRADRRSGIKKLVMNSELVWASIAGGASYSENWNIADQDSPSVQLTWTELVGDLDVVSNKLVQLSAPADIFARAEHDLTNDEHYCEVKVEATSATTSQGGPMTRMSSIATTGYFVDFLPLNASTMYQLRKVVAAVVTAIGSGATEAALSANTQYLIRLTSDSADLHTVARDGVTKSSDTDTSIVALTRCGVFAGANGASRIKLDDWFASDIASAAGPLIGGKLVERSVLLGRLAA